jgi:cellulose synthase/poly-beta-1,6-N-acetylglucosamine synthase-like glycosyltransferase
MHQKSREIYCFSKGKSKKEPGKIPEFTAEINENLPAEHIACAQSASNNYAFATNRRFPYHFPPSMPLLDYIFPAVLFIYIAEIVFFKKGLDRTEKYERNHSYEPVISIIVAARNEEENIAACVLSLTRLDYPRDKCEIIVVNDHSTDNTASIVEKLAREHANVKLLNAKAGEGHLRSKANALAQGIEQSKGEVLFFTDADCTVLPTWVKETLSYYTENVGIVAGLTGIKSQNTFEGMQALDWVYLLAVASSAATWNMPLTAVGNNLSVRRSAYERVGGYQALPFSVTEDYTLVQAIWQRTGLLIRYPINNKTVVESRACPTWKELFRQRQRWGVGGLDMVLRGLLLTSVHFAMHLLIFSGLIMMIVSPSIAPSAGIFLSSVVGKLFADIYLLWKPLHTFDKLSLMKYFFAFELYYAVYQVLLPFIALLSKEVIWKERALGAVETAKSDGGME